MKFLLIFIPLILSFGENKLAKVPVQLIEYSNDKTAPYCGYQMEYGLLKVKLEEDAIQGKKGDTLFLFHTCPRETMEQTVKQYINNNKYQCEIGKEISKSDVAKALSVLKLTYPKDKALKIYYGKFSTLE